MPQALAQALAVEVVLTGVELFALPTKSMQASLHHFTVIGKPKLANIRHTMSHQLHIPVASSANFPDKPKSNLHLICWAGPPL